MPMKIQVLRTFQLSSFREGTNAANCLQLYDLSTRLKDVLSKIETYVYGFFITSY